VALLGAVAAAALAGLPAGLAAAGLGAAFVAATVWRPSAGLAALVLASPFLLGEHQTPYFLLAPAGALAVLLSAVAHGLRREGRGARPWPAHPATLAAVGLVLAAAVALPLNLRDLLEDLWLWRALDWPRMLARGIPDIANLKYPERVVVLGLGAGLFAVAARPAAAPAVTGALRVLPALVLAVSGFGLLRFAGAIAPSGEYLTLSFWTWAHPDHRLTAVAWNPDYLAQFLALALPLALTVAGLPGPRWSRGLAGAAAGLGGLALLLTFQRGGYLGAAVALGALLGLRRRARAGAPGGAWRLVAVAGLLLLAAGTLDRLVLDGRILARLAGFARDPHRVLLWTAALRMAGDQPLLGVGTGRYAFFFHEYVDRGILVEFGPFWGTAHSTYLHVLAEQGTVGLLAFAGLFGGVAWRLWRRLPDLPPERRLWARGLLASLAGWLAYGVVQYTLRVDALFFLVCILGGTAWALAPPAGPPVPRRRVALAGAGVALVLLGWRAGVALERPVSPRYEAGFHGWERQADGSAARWTHQRAAMVVGVRGPVIELAFQAPLPGIETRPQTVRVWIARQLVATVRLRDVGWQTLRVPVTPPAGSRRVLVELETAYSVVPRRAGVSGDSRRLGVLVREVAWRDA
jgi:O-antigen ligase